MEKIIHIPSITIDPKVVFFEDEQPEEFELYNEQRKAVKDAWKDILYNENDIFQAAQFIVPGDNGQTIILSPSTREGTDWQLSFIDKDGVPAMHEDYYKNDNPNGYKTNNENALMSRLADYSLRSREIVARVLYEGEQTMEEKNIQNVAEEEKVIVEFQSASISNYEGYVVLAQYDRDTPHGDEKIYLGKKENYNNRGSYDNTDNSLVFISENRKMFNFLCSAGWIFSQQKLIDKGVFTAEDYAEFASLKETVLKQFNETRQIRFDINVDIKSSKDSGVLFSYPDWEGKEVERKRRLFVDMDGTLARFHDEVQYLERMYEEGFFANLRPFENVVEGVREFIKENPDVEVFALSSVIDSEYCIGEKNQWLDKYLPEIPVENRMFPQAGSSKSDFVERMTGKAVTIDDFLLDDYTVNLVDWQPPGRGIKLLNAINHTRGSWQNDRIRFDREPSDLAKGLATVMLTEEHIYDEKWEQQVELPRKWENDEPLVDIYNLEYDGEGYLHFAVDAEGYVLEGLFRLHDPANGNDMELVSIDYGDRHPIIERQWDRIEHALVDASMDRYKEIIFPCKVGQVVYGFDYPRTDITVVAEETVESLEITEDGFFIETSGDYYNLEDFGKRVFLSKAEAEAALAERENAEKDVSGDFPVYVAIESTEDYTDTTFHQSLVDDDIKNPDGSYGKIVNKYRLVEIGKEGRIVPLDNRVFDSFDEASLALLMTSNYRMVNYDDMVKEAENIHIAVTHYSLDKISSELNKRDEIWIIPEDATGIGRYSFDVLSRAEKILINRDPEMVERYALVNRLNEEAEQTYGFNGISDDAVKQSYILARDKNVPLNELEARVTDVFRYDGMTGAEIERTLAAEKQFAADVAKYDVIQSGNKLLWNEYVSSKVYGITPSLYDEYIDRVDDGTTQLLGDVEKYNPYRLVLLTAGQFGERYSEHEIVYNQPMSDELVALYNSENKVPFLETVYAMAGNAGEQPFNYYGHTLSTDDIIVILTPDGADCHYVARFGFEAEPDVDKAITSAQRKMARLGMTVKEEFELLDRIYSFGDENINKKIEDRLDILTMEYLYPINLAGVREVIRNNQDKLKTINGWELQSNAFNNITFEYNEGKFTVDRETIRDCMPQQKASDGYIYSVSKVIAGERLRNEINNRYDYAQRGFLFEQVLQELKNRNIDMESEQVEENINEYFTHSQSRNADDIADFIENSIADEDSFIQNKEIEQEALGSLSSRFADFVFECEFNEDIMDAFAEKINLSSRSTAKNDVWALLENGETEEFYSVLNSVLDEWSDLLNEDVVLEGKDILEALEDVDGYVREYAEQYIDSKDIQEYFNSRLEEVSARRVPGHYPDFKSKEEVDKFIESQKKLETVYDNYFNEPVEDEPDFDEDAPSNPYEERDEFVSNAFYELADRIDVFFYDNDFYGYYDSIGIEPENSDANKMEIFKDLVAGHTQPVIQALVEMMEVDEWEEGENPELFAKYNKLIYDVSNLPRYIDDYGKEVPTAYTALAKRIEEFSYDNNYFNYADDVGIDPENREAQVSDIEGYLVNRTEDLQYIADFIRETRNEYQERDEGLGNYSVEIREATDLLYTLDNLNQYLDLYYMRSPEAAQNAEIPINEFLNAEGKVLEGERIPVEKSSTPHFADRSIVYNAVKKFEEDNNIPVNQREIQPDGTYTDKEFLYMAYDRYVGMSHQNDLSIQAYKPHMDAILADHSVAANNLLLIAEIYYAQRNGLKYHQIDYALNAAKEAFPVATMRNLRHGFENGLSVDHLDVILGENSLTQEHLIEFMINGGSIENAKALKGSDVALYYTLKDHLNNGTISPENARAVIKTINFLKEANRADYATKYIEMEAGKAKPRFSMVDFDYMTESLVNMVAENSVVRPDQIEEMGFEFWKQNETNNIREFFDDYLFDVQAAHNYDRIGELTDLAFELEDFARDVIQGQNRPWGYWGGRISNPEKPQDYINIDITGYDRDGGFVIEAAQVVLDGKIKEVFAFDEQNWKDFIDKDTEINPDSALFMDRANEIVSWLDLNLESDFVLYNNHGIGEHTLEEHYNLLKEKGYDIMPSYEESNIENAQEISEQEDGIKSLAKRIISFVEESDARDYYLDLLDSGDDTLASLYSLGLLDKHEESDVVLENVYNALIERGEFYQAIVDALNDVKDNYNGENSETIKDDVDEILHYVDKVNVSDITKIKYKSHSYDEFNRVSTYTFSCEISGVKDTLTYEVQEHDEIDSFSIHGKNNDIWDKMSNIDRVRLEEILKEEVSFSRYVTELDSIETLDALLMFKEGIWDDKQLFTFGLGEEKENQLYDLIHIKEEQFRAKELLKEADALPVPTINNPSKGIAFDVETTGFSKHNDEILQLSILDLDGNVLFNSYVKPYWKTEWTDAMAVNGITPEMVENAPYPHEILPEIKGIVESADVLVGYNNPFDMGFLEQWGINFENKKVYDVMREFAKLYGVWREDKGQYKLQKLGIAAEFFGFEFNAHDSLEDTKATLHCYKQMGSPEKSWAESQLEIVQAMNPAPHGNLTWIRSVDDIHDFVGGIQWGIDNNGYEKGTDFTPDYTAEMMQQALETGMITVYSSYPIEQGIFVTPSRMEAESYAGDGIVYEKTVRVSEVAWIDEGQGQYANVLEWGKTKAEISKELRDRGYDVADGEYGVVEEGLALYNKYDHFNNLEEEGSKEAIATYIENRFFVDNPIGDEDWCYNDPERNEIVAVHFNPDSSAGGQFVENHISYDLIMKAQKEAGTDEDYFFSILSSECTQYLIDIDTPQFKENAEYYKTHQPDLEYSKEVLVGTAIKDGIGIDEYYKEKFVEVHPELSKEEAVELFESQKAENLLMFKGVTKSFLQDRSLTVSDEIVDEAYNHYVTTLGNSENPEKFANYIENTYFLENPIGEKEWFFNYTARQTAASIYFNPDANAGGQLVVSSFPYELILQAKEETETTEDFFEYLNDYAYTELFDVDTSDFRAIVIEYKDREPDFIDCTEETMNRLVQGAQHDRDFALATAHYSNEAKDFIRSDVVKAHADELIYCYKNDKSIDEFNEWISYRLILGEDISFEEYKEFDSRWDANVLDLNPLNPQEVAAVKTWFERFKEGTLTKVENSIVNDSIIFKIANGIGNTIKSNNDLNIIDYARVGGASDEEIAEISRAITLVSHGEEGFSVSETTLLKLANGIGNTIGAGNDFSITQFAEIGGASNEEITLIQKAIEIAADRGIETYVAHREEVETKERTSQFVETNVGSMPVEDYREIVAIQHGFDSYNEMYKAGYRIGNGYDKEPERSDNMAKVQEKATQEGVAIPEEKKDAKELLNEQLQEGIKNVLNSENYKNWLDTSSKLFLNNYSFNNAILVWLQNPDATYTMGFEQWKDYGRSVAKGAKGIKIFVPVMAYEKKEGYLWNMIKDNLQKQLKDNPSLEQASYRIGMSKFEVTSNRNGIYGLVIGGQERGLKTEKEMKDLIKTSVLNKVPMYFTVGTVFNHSDTIIPEYLWVKKGFTKDEMVRDENGKAIKNKRGEYKIVNTPERQAKFKPHLDLSVPQIDEAKAAILYEALKAVSERNSIHVYEKNREDDKTLRGGADGYFSRQFSSENPKGYIVIPTDLDATKKVSVLLHEMGHSDMHGDLTKLAEKMGEDYVPSQMREVQAESVAYIVGKNFGLSTETSSFQYLAGYTQGFELQALSKSIEIIYNECKKLTNELTKELESRGFNMDLTERKVEAMDKDSVEPIATVYMDYAIEQNNRIAEIEKELPILAKQNAGKENVLSVIVAQNSNIQKQKEDIVLIKELVPELEAADTFEKQQACIAGIEAAKERVENYKKDFANLSEQFQDITRDGKGLKDRFVANPIATLEAMKQDYPKLAELTTAQIQYLAKSDFVNREISPLLRNEPQQFVNQVCERASQIDKVASKNGMFVEVSFCEQWTDKPIVKGGSLMHPKVADTIIKQAETQIRNLKAQAQNLGDYFPYSKCDLMVYKAENGQIATAFKTRVDIGDGSQAGLSDHLKQIGSAKAIAADFEKATSEKGVKDKILFNESRSAKVQDKPAKEALCDRGISHKEWQQQINTKREEMQKQKENQHGEQEQDNSNKNKSGKDR